MSDEQSKKEEINWQAKADEYLNSWKRTAADFENYKKRREKEDQALVAFTKEFVLLKLLPLLEALEPALQHAPKDEQYREWRLGIESIMKQLEEAFKELGVERVKTVGEKYHHDLHEAVELVEGKGESGAVIEEITPGYRIHGKVIRPAKVKVAR